MRGLGYILCTVVAVCVLLVLSQLLAKHSLRQARGEPGNVVHLLCALLPSLPFWLAIASIILAACLWLILLQSAPVSLLYPFLSLSYVLMVPAARLAFGEPITLNKILGTAVICIGVLLVSRAGDFGA